MNKTTVFLISMISSSGLFLLMVSVGSLIQISNAMKTSQAFWAAFHYIFRLAISPLLLWVFIPALFAFACLMHWKVSGHKKIS